MISTERRRAPLWLPWLLLALVTIGALAFCHLAGWWLYSSDGERLLRDFVGQWAASRRAVGGEAALAYDWRLHPTYLASLTGEPEPVALYFVYPPHFLFLVLPLAPFGYVEASIAMLAITFACYVLAVNGIVRSTGTALLVALSGGGAFYALFWVQNSLLVAALLVGGLVALPRRPVLAGVLFGLLTIKPQLGLLLPLVLLIDRRWSTILSATVTTLCLLLLSELAFGAGINRQFLKAMAQTPQFLDMTRLDPLWQTVFGLARQWFGDWPGWAIHMLVAAIVAFAVGRLWATQDLPWRIRSAALIAGSLLMSPYLFVYDSVVLSAAALMLQTERQGPALRPAETLLLFASCLLPMAAPVLLNAAVPLAAGLMLALAVRRAAQIPGRGGADEGLRPTVGHSPFPA